jgi:hypothetical protein
MTIYSDGFYINQIDGAYSSARFYSSLLERLLAPSVIVDVGCGRGAWLKAFSDAANTSGRAVRTCGIDGPWNSKDKLVFDVTEYHSVDLNRLHESGLREKADLVISVETAEHIFPESTGQFINSICSFSDVVVFSGAFKGQGGLYHFNERLHSQWAEYFGRNGYSVYDLFRPIVWGRSDVNYWYQQNVFLYVRDGSEAQVKLWSEGILPQKNLKFLDCVHYLAFQERSTILGLLKKLAQEKLPPGLTIFLSNLKAKLRGALGS